MTASLGWATAGEEGRSFLHLREFFLDGARTKLMLLASTNERANAQPARTRDHQNAARRVDFRAQNIGQTVRAVDVHGKEAVIVWRAQHFDP